LTRRVTNIGLIAFLRVIRGDGYFMREQEVSQGNCVGKLRFDIPKEIAFETQNEVPNGTLENPYGSTPAGGIEHKGE
jgi:hypothetical protein